MIIYLADYMKNVESAGSIIVLETGVNGSLQVAGAWQARGANFVTLPSKLGGNETIVHGVPCPYENAHPLRTPPRTLGRGLRQGLMGWCFLMGEVPL